MGFRRLARQFHAADALVGVALFFGAAFAWPGCQSYGVTIPCESDAECYAEQACDLARGICRPLSCVRACEERECGDDGCGVSCGVCPAGEECSPAGLCVGDAPCCGTRICGPDPCAGTSCGTCPWDEDCDANGRCQNTCTPHCIGRECGPDGCGGTCGSCSAGEICDQGYCTCVPDCTGRECGPDGCGVSCGVCPAGEECSPAGLCVGDAPCCGTRICGPDPCAGTSCGTCPWDEDCDANGRCQNTCTPYCVGRECGPDGCGGSCGSCPGGEDCDSEGQCGCQPDCFGKECGPDGCGGTCGSCNIPDTCTPDGQCICMPDCTGRMCGPDPICGSISCGTCPAGQFCDQGYCTCMPNCTGRECGPDPVCGMSCGTCATGELCNANGLCEAVGNGQQVGEPCDFDTVNVGAGECTIGLVCLGVLPDATGSPCATDLDCVAYVNVLWNPDCVIGGCGASFCAGECAAGLCDFGFTPIETAGTCYCVPDSSGDTGQPGDPCPFDRVNADAAECAVGLSCLGVMPDPTTYPCPAGDVDCLGFFTAHWNPDCVEGGCGLSFCSPLCTGGVCPAGFDPYDISGDCYCVPGTSTGTGVQGDPCPFTGGVNAAADNCGSGLDCLGIPPDPELPCTTDPDCLSGMAESWNPDCVGGACGASFCAGECNNGACDAGFDPYNITGDCYCVPSE